MDKEMFYQNPKISVELKQTAKGFWYVGSLRVELDNLDEMDNLINLALAKIKRKIENLNNPYIPKGEDSRKEEETLLDANETKLFEQLKNLRREIANRENLPPYIIFHDSVLKRFARLKPKTKEEMINVDGVGEKLFNKYGELFLEMINYFRENVLKGE